MDTGMTARLRLLMIVLPWALGVAAVKLVLALGGVEPLDVNPLLSGLVAAEVFLLGFLLAGTNADFKEAERLPSEMAGTLETMADEWRSIGLRGHEAVRDSGLAALRDIGDATVRWLHGEGTHLEALDRVEALNPLLVELDGRTEVSYVNRLRGDQAALRRALLRVCAIRRTSFVAAGYVIAEAVAALVIVALLLTDLGPAGEAAFFAGAVTLLLVFVNRLIRDLDNPFEYRNGQPGTADVTLDPIHDALERLGPRRERPEAGLPSAEPAAAG